MSEILVLNAGSSTLKFSLFASAQTDSDLDLICGGAIEGIGAESGRFRARDKNGEAIADKTLLGLRGPLLSHDGALERLGGWLEERSLGRALSAVGHRVAHGGEHFIRPVQVNEALLSQLEALVPLAPLHQPHNLAAIKAVAVVRPELPQVACFDTAFHRSQPAVAQAFALPRELSEAGIRRYGFHGLSYAYIASVLAAALGGLDGLVFTAGIGERAPIIRARVCEQAAWLGVRLDAAANEAGGPQISADHSRVSVWIIPTNEELMIARHTKALLAL